MAQFTPSPQTQVAERIHQTPINGVYFIEHTIHQDNRGFFAELALISDLNQVLKQEFTIKQVNLARSEVNVARGFHYEDWNKLVTIIHGHAFCALVDIRSDSSTFGQSITLTLGENGNSLQGNLYIPQGVANSYCVVKGPLDYLYGVDKLYRDRVPSDNGSISLFDPDLKISWPIPKEKMIISERDQNAQTMRHKFPDTFA
jgi:dTDP-4-dehydrorhamnose 3,5-epimerase